MSPAPSTPQSLYAVMTAGPLGKEESEWRTRCSSARGLTCDDGRPAGLADDYAYGTAACTPGEGKTVSVVNKEVVPNPGEVVQLSKSDVDGVTPDRIARQCN